MKRTLIFIMIIPLLLVQCRKEGSGTFVHPPVDLHGHVMFSDGTPASGVVVSDGYNCTATDESGFYKIDSRWQNARNVFISIPADAAIPLGGNGRPSFFKRLDYSVQRYDFTLERQTKETKFRLLCIGDPQVCTANKGLLRFESETAPDVKAFVQSHGDMKTYSLSMGDHTHNQWALLPDIFALLDMEHIGVANFPVIGNHDHKSAADDYTARADYEKTIAPCNYSFDRGDFHIVVVDNINYVSKKYTEVMSEDVEKWLARDLSFVSRDKSIIFASHAGNTQPNNPGVYELLSEFKEARWVAGHNHAVENYTYSVNGKEISLHIVGTANGVDWAGTICGDGAPMGYAVFEMDGTHVSNHYYKPTLLSDDFQIRMYHSSSFPAFSHYVGSETDLFFDWNRSNGATIFNVWGYDPAKWTVKVLEDGVEVASPIRDNSQYDMWSCSYFYLEKNCATNSYCKRKEHLFYYLPVNPSAKITVVAEDEFGHVYRQENYTDSTRSAGTYE